MKPMQPASREAQGFTLIELLTVIAIIGILATILIPNVASTVENSKVTKCTANLSEIYKGLQTYTENRLPTERDRLPYAFKNSSVDTNASWATRILSNVGDPNVFICPSDTVSHEAGDRSYAANATRGSGSSDAPFGNSDARSPMRTTDLSTHRGQLILISERPTEGGASRGRMDNDIAASLDQTASTGHRKGKFGNYLMAGGTVRLIEASIAATNKTGYGNYWSLYTGNR